jgi:Protein of unknown function (DUF3551)
MVRRVGSIAGAGSTTVYRFTARARATISSVLDEPAALRPNLQPCANFGPRGQWASTAATWKVSTGRSPRRRLSPAALQTLRCAGASSRESWKQSMGWYFQHGGTKEVRMRLIIVGAFAAIVSIEKPAQAQDYPWCAYYNLGQDGGGATNCGFVTFQQCLAMVKRGLVGPVEPILCTSRYRDHIRSLGTRGTILVKAMASAATPAASQYSPRCAAPSHAMAQ